MESFKPSQKKSLKIEKVLETLSKSNQPLPYEQAQAIHLLIYALANLAIGISIRMAIEKPGKISKTVKDAKAL